jgi:Uma2 family endonuclease
MIRRVTSTYITAEDVLRRDSRWRDCEIWDGVPMVREPSGGWAEEVASRVVAPLAMHVRERTLGWVFLSSQGFLLARRPDRLLASDGAYVSKARLPSIPERGFIELAPDFAIEVRSPDDTWEKTVEKCGIWIAHGAGVVWGIDPLTRTAAIFRPGEEPVVHGREGRLDAAPVLPDFHLEVADLFEGLG